MKKELHSTEKFQAANSWFDKTIEYIGNPFLDDNPKSLSLDVYPGSARHVKNEHVVDSICCMEDVDSLLFELLYERNCRQRRKHWRLMHRERTSKLQPLTYTHSFLQVTSNRTHIASYIEMIASQSYTHLKTGAFCHAKETQKVNHQRLPYSKWKWLLGSSWQREVQGVSKSVSLDCTKSIYDPTENNSFALFKRPKPRPETKQESRLQCQR